MKRRTWACSHVDPEVDTLAPCFGCYWKNVAKYDSCQDGFWLFVSVFLGLNHWNLQQWRTSTPSFWRPANTHTRLTNHPSFTPWRRTQIAACKSAFLWSELEMTSAVVRPSWSLHTAHVHLLKESWLNVFLSSRLHIQPKHQNDSESVIKGIIFSEKTTFFWYWHSGKNVRKKDSKGFWGAQIPPTTLYTWKNRRKFVCTTDKT